MRLGVDAVYKAFETVSLGRGSKGMVRLWAAVRMHCLAGWRVGGAGAASAGCSQHGSQGMYSQDYGSQQPILPMATCPVMVLVGRDLQVR